MGGKGIDVDDKIRNLMKEYNLSINDLLAFCYRELDNVIFIM